MLRLAVVSYLAGYALMIAALVRVDYRPEVFGFACWGLAGVLVYAADRRMSGGHR